MKKLLQICLFSILLFGTTSFAQNTKYGFSFGLTFITSPSLYTDDIDTSGRAFGLSRNFHFGGKFKLGLQPLPIRLTGQLLYTSFNGSRDNVIVDPSTVVDIETSSNLFTLAFGAEYLFSEEPVSPYATLELQLNSQGSTKLNLDYPNSSRELSVEGNTRWGLGLGMGIDLGIIPQIDLDAAARFNLVNIFGKEDEEDTFTTFTLTLSVLYNPASAKR